MVVSASPYEAKPHDEDHGALRADVEYWARRVAAVERLPQHEEACRHEAEEEQCRDSHYLIFILEEVALRCREQGIEWVPHLQVLKAFSRIGESLQAHVHPAEHQVENEDDDLREEDQDLDPAKVSNVSPRVPVDVTLQAPELLLAEPDFLLVIGIALLKAHGVVVRQLDEGDRVQDGASHLQALLPVRTVSIVRPQISTDCDLQRVDNVRVKDQADVEEVRAQIFLDPLVLAGYLLRLIVPYAA